jgi:hypothetical protein
MQHSRGYHRQCCIALDTVMELLPRRLAAAIHPIAERHSRQLQLGSALNIVTSPSHLSVMGRLQASDPLPYPDATRCFATMIQQHQAHHQQKARACRNPEGKERRQAGWGESVAEQHRYEPGDEQQGGTD